MAMVVNCTCAIKQFPNPQCPTHGEAAKAAEAEKYAEYENDAWRKLAVLWQENTRQWSPRLDLKVTALGCDRVVKLSLGTGSPSGDPWTYRSWKETTRNVGTMRELAQAIMEACDFVEAVNPKWGTHLP